MKLNAIPGVTSRTWCPHLAERKPRNILHPIFPALVARDFTTRSTVCSWYDRDHGCSYAMLPCQPSLPAASGMPPSFERGFCGLCIAEAFHSRKYTSESFLRCDAFAM